MKRASAGEEGAKSVAEAAASFLAFWNGHVRLHFIEEEEVLLPIYRRYRSPMQSEAIRRMLDDHAWIRERVWALEEAVEQGGELGELMGAIGERLHDHIRLEERVIFEEMQELFSDEDLSEAGRRSLAFRLALRGESAVGPHRGLDLPSEDHFSEE